MISLYLQRIIREIIPLSGFTSSVGLLNGKMGISMLLYQYTKYIHDAEVEDYTGYLINEIIENLAEASFCDFDSGFIGIGWGVNQLIADGLIEIDSDEMLEDIDKALWDETGLCLVESEQMAGVGLYILSRKETSKYVALWDQRLSAWLKDLERITVQPETTCQSYDIIYAMYCFSVCRKSGLFIEEINKIWPKLATFIEFEYHRTTSITEKYILYHLCVLMGKTECLPFLHDPFPESTWHPTLSDINWFYWYKLLCNKWGIKTPDVFTAKINSIVSDQTKMDELLSSLNPQKVVLENIVGGFAWSLLQFSIENSSI